MLKLLTSFGLAILGTISVLGISIVLGFCAYKLESCIGQGGIIVALIIVIIVCLTSLIYGVRK